jgi:hypothetical protein
MSPQQIKVFMRISSRMAIESALWVHVMDSMPARSIETTSEALDKKQTT